MKPTVLLILLLVKASIVLSNKRKIESFGYQVEKFKVKTSDGYLLHIFRIPNPEKPIILLQAC